MSNSSSSKVPLEGEESFVKSFRRKHQVKVTLNEDEFGLLNDLVEKRKSDRASVFRDLLNENETIKLSVLNVQKDSAKPISTESINNSKKSFESIPLKYLQELKEAFEKALISEEEYQLLRELSLGLKKS